METDLILSMCVIIFNKTTTWLNLLQEPKRQNKYAYTKWEPDQISSFIKLSQKKGGQTISARHRKQAIVGGLKWDLF